MKYIVGFICGIIVFVITWVIRLIASLGLLVWSFKSDPVWGYNIKNYYVHDILLSDKWDEWLSENVYDYYLKWE